MNTVRPTSFEEACEMTGRPITIDLSVYPEDMRLYQESLYKLMVISEGVNKANDNWKANKTDGSQERWSPWFLRSPSGFVFGDSYYSDSFAFAGCGSRLCYGNEEDSNYMGENFLELWINIIDK